MRHRNAPPPGRRPRRVAETVRQVVTTFLQEEARDPRIGFVTVTGVEITHDLQRAVVKFTVHGDEAAREQTFEGLQHAAVAVRRRLGEALSVRVVPEIVFTPDRGREHAARIEELLAELQRPEDEAS